MVNLWKSGKFSLGSIIFIMAVFWTKYRDENDVITNENLINHFMFFCLFIFV